MPPAENNTTFDENFEPDINKGSQPVSANDLLIPLRRENQRLLRANNSLHLHLIKQAEGQDQQERQGAAKLRKLEAANNDLKFLYTQKTRLLKEREGTINDLKNKLESVMQNKEVFVSQGKAIAHSLSPQMHMQVSSVTTTPAVSLDETFFARLRNAEQQLAQWVSREQELTVREQNVQGELTARQQEINRLSGLIEQRTNFDQVKANHDVEELQKVVSKLNSQIDFLNTERASLTAKVRFFEEQGSTEEVAGAMSSLQEQFEALRTRYQAHAQTTKELQADLHTCQHREREAVEQVGELNSSIDSIKAQHAAAVADLQQKYDKALFSVDELRLGLEQAKSARAFAEKQEEQAQGRVQELLAAAAAKEDEHSRHKDLYSQALSAVESATRDRDSARTELAILKADVAAELDRAVEDRSVANDSNTRLLQQLGEVKHSRSELETDNGRLQDSLESMAGRVKSLQNEVAFHKSTASAVTSALQQAKERGAAAEAAAQDKRVALAAAEATLGTVRAERDTLLQDSSAASQQVAELQQLLQQERGDLAIAKAQVSRLQESLADSTQAGAKVEAAEAVHRQLQQQLASSQEVIGQLMEEKEDLEARLSECKQAVTAMAEGLESTEQSLLDRQQDVEAAKSELAAANKAYTAVTAELADRTALEEEMQQQLRQQARQLEEHQQALSAVSEQLASAQAATRSSSDTNAATLAQLDESAEKERAAAAAAAASKEREEQLTRTVAQLTSECDSAKRQQQSLSQQVAALTAQTASKDNEVGVLKQQLAELASLCRQLDNTREKAEEKIKALAAVQKGATQQLSVSQQQYSQQQHVVEKQQQQIAQLERLVQAGEKESAELRSKFQQQEEERVSASRAQSVYQQQQAQVEGAVAQLTGQTKLLANEVEQRDQVVEALKQQLEQQRAIARQLSQDNASKAKELQAVCADLANMVKENQFVNQELSQTASQRDQRTQELESIINRLRFVEEVSLVKDKENTDIVNTYRDAAAEVERLKLAIRGMEAERAEMRAHATATGQASSSLQLQVQELKLVTQQQQIDLEAYEKQNQALSRQIEGANRSAHASQVLAESMQQEAQAARAVAQQSEGARDQTQGAAAALAEANEQLATQLRAAATEIQALQGQLASQLEENKTLELLVADTRLSALKSHSLHGESEQQREDIVDTLTASLRALEQQNQSYAQQLQELHMYREKQTAENKRLLRALARLDLPSGSDRSLAVSRSLSGPSLSPPSSPSRSPSPSPSPSSSSSGRQSVRSSASGGGNENTALGSGRHRTQREERPQEEEESPYRSSASSDVSLNATAAASAAASSYAGLSGQIRETRDSEAAISMLAGKVEQLEGALSQQFSQIRNLSSENTHLKSVAFKYEAELVQAEREARRIQRKGNELKLYKVKRDRKDRSFVQQADQDGSDSSSSEMNQRVTQQSD